MKKKTIEKIPYLGLKKVSRKRGEIHRGNGDKDRRS